MGFLELFSVASFPVIKVLLVTAVGLLLALDNINLLGKDARIQTNHLVHYVFNPALVGGNLADTITSENVVLLWFMPVNILMTFLLGSALGWIIVKLTKPPKHTEGLIVGVCSAGNLGNLPIIIIPAICKDKGSPFGDPDVCYHYGMAYASLSMAIGAVYIWTYVYNIMRISSSKIHKESSINTSNANLTLQASGDLSESLIEEITEPLNPVKGDVDDACILLLSKNESELKVKVSMLDKIQNLFGMILGNPNVRAIFSPATIGAIVGFIIGVVPQLRSFLIGSNAPLHVIEDSVSMVGDAAIPATTLIMGANLLKGLKGASTPLWTIIGIIAARYIFLPIFGILIVKGITHLLQPDPLYEFILLLQYALPPAMSIGTIAQLFGAGESECSMIMLWTYGLASVAVTLWSTFFLYLVA